MESLPPKPHTPVSSAPHTHRWWHRPPQHVLLIGSGAALERIHHTLQQTQPSCIFVGLFTDEPTALSPSLQTLHKGALQDLFNFLPTHNDIHDIYAALPAESAPQVDLLSKYSDTHGIRFFYVPPYQIFGGYQHSLSLRGIALLTHRKEPLARSSNAALKRTFDFLVSTLVLLMTFPIFFLYTFISVKRHDSAQAILLIHSLSGLDGQVFRAYSFNLPHHPRLAHLPRFLNVWKGDMSLVGHAPYPVHLTEYYQEALSHFMVHHFGRPGLITPTAPTAPSSADTSAAKLEQQLKADIDYIENWTFLRDLRILFSRSLHPSSCT